MPFMLIMDNTKQENGKTIWSMKMSTIKIIKSLTMKQIICQGTDRTDSNSKPPNNFTPKSPKNAPKHQNNPNCP